MNTCRDRRAAAGRRAVGLLAVLAAAAALTVGCSDSGGGSDSGGTAIALPTEPAGSGPFFGECGGVDVSDVSKATGVNGLTNTVNNPSACEWVTGADQLGPQMSFNWYRGSPIGRERATEQLARASVENLTINGHSGFIASDLGICEIGIAFGADFFEWSVSLGTTARTSTAPSPSATADEKVCEAAKTLSTLTIERSK
nr:DUF3558 domain-containing protein [Williamsia sp. CHRR-6]